MKKLSWILIFVFIWALFLQTSVFAVSAQYMCVMDSLTGRVLYEKNAYTTYSMASTTKIMTAIVALENCNPDDIATVSYNASRTEGSSLYLQEGEKIRMIDLIYGLMLRSGNDAAVVIAEHIGGSVEGFCDLMNEKAKEIGAKNSSFKNPNGLDAEGHYTTAYDLALITRYALKNPEFAKMCATKNKVIYTVDTNRGITVTNHNRLLNMYEGCDGVKTGYTKKTGRCLVSSATRNGFQVICVTLNAPNDWNDHSSMLDAAFNEYKPVEFIKKAQLMGSINIKNGEIENIDLLSGEDILIPLKDGEAPKANMRLEKPDSICAPVVENQVIGKAIVSWDGIVIKEVDLLAALSVSEKEPICFSQNFIQILKNWLLIPTNWSRMV